jgi:hypothetical protein
VVQKEARVLRLLETAFLEMTAKFRCPFDFEAETPAVKPVRAQALRRAREKLAMKRRDSSTSLGKYLDRVERRQKNIVWPDPIVNSRAVDKFLWRGIPNPSFVQRVAAWLFGMCYIVIGIVLFGFGRSEPSLFLEIFALLGFLSALRCF